MIVEVEQGSLCGKKCSTILGQKPYLCFFGVPYAVVPTGDLRFQAPKPILRWNGVHDATYEREPCIQKSPLHKSIIGSEDCLYLNLYVPETSLPANTLKPVMVFIHGGAFCFSSGHSGAYSPDFLMDYDVIVVSVNYRLQILGFLNLGIPECPGNAGLKDQVMALQWIKDNIIHFGGDPNNITLFGVSAGAVSAHFLSISPLSQGLFHKVILQSGFAFSTWSLCTDPIKTAFEIGRKLGYFGDDRVELINHLKIQPAKDLITAGNQLRDEQKLTNSQSITVFAPSLEFIKEGAVIPEHPSILFRTAPPMPMICGSTDLDGVFGIALMSKKDLEIIFDDISILLPKYFSIDPNELPNKTAQITNLYFNDSNTYAAKLHSLSNLYTDIYLYQIQDSLDYLSHTSSPPFVYEFCYNGKMNLMRKRFSFNLNCPFKGACHADDMCYLFYAREFLHSQEGLDENDLKVVANMCSMWTSFAKSGNPSSNQIWQPYAKEHPCYLKIDTDSKLVDGPVRGNGPQILKKIMGPFSMNVLEN